MEIPHPHLPKVTGMVFIEVRSVVMLSSGHTTSTGMLAVFANTSVAGGDMAAAGRGEISLCARLQRCKNKGAARLVKEVRTVFGSL